MRNKRGFRGGFGFAQIMATLLVVLPTLAFMIVILFDYWSVMQADYRIKLVANLTSEYAIARANLRDFTNGSGGPATDYQAYLSRVNQLCPANTNITVTKLTDAPNLGEVDVVVKYTYNGTYIKNKTLVTRMDAYSYQDQNASIEIICQ